MGKIKLLNTSENGYFANNQIDIGSSIPTSGSYKVGDIIIKSTQVAGEAIGWICVQAGTPGIWSEFGGMLTDERELIINPESIGMDELNTEVKSKLTFIDSVNRNLKQIQTKINDIENEIENGVGDVSSETIGDLNQLKTNDKTSVVNSINEMYELILGQKESLINNINDLIDNI